MNQTKAHQFFKACKTLLKDEPILTLYELEQLCKNRTFFILVLNEWDQAGQNLGSLLTERSVLLVQGIS